MTHKKDMTKILSVRGDIRQKDLGDKDKKSIQHELIKDLVSCSEKTLESLKETLQEIRTGRAQPDLVENISVDYFGTPTLIKSLGNVTVSEARQIVITPWDKTAIKAIEKAIQSSKLSINPKNDGESIHINAPELTQDRRVELAKIVNKTAEEARIAIRNIRRDINERLKIMEQDGELTENDLWKQQASAQEETDEFINKIELILKDKVKEIMEK